MSDKHTYDQTVAKKNKLDAWIMKKMTENYDEWCKIFNKVHFHIFTTVYCSLSVQYGGNSPLLLHPFYYDTPYDRMRNPFVALCPE